MRRPRSGLIGRAVAYFAIRECIPLYAVYALLFADRGLSPAAISSLFVLWSVTAFVLEIPSGALADAVPRRSLLVLSSVLYAAGFALWVVVPTYPGFAVGFVLWGASGALMSGTFEALLYDELAAVGAAERYPKAIALANAAATVAMLLGMFGAAPLFAAGGYQLVGWVSVGVALAQGAVALSLPRAPTVAVAGVTVGAEGLGRRYLAVLRAGVTEVSRTRTIRHAVMGASVVAGLLACDEYFPVLAREAGVPTAQVPLLMAMTVVGDAIGTALAAVTEATRRRLLAWLLAGAGVLLGIGAGSGRPAGFLAIAVGYGLASNVRVVAEARLQSVIAGTARATVTSAFGFLSEVVAVTVFAGFAVGSSRLAVGRMVVILCVLLVGLALLLPRWLPIRGPAPREDG